MEREFIEIRKTKICTVRKHGELLYKCADVCVLCKQIWIQDRV